MTQSSYFLTNGSSLEDCHTNFFALADLCGIKWRQYTSDKHGNDLSEDPVLHSYSRCINAELLCVWRRVRNNTHDQPSNHQRIDGNYVNYTKELWIFWYGEDPDFTDIIVGSLTDGENGSWETGLSYECRTLLFKALHNLIEKLLLSKGYSRLGRWFFQVKYAPNGDKSKSDILNDGTQVTFSFNFFLHGDSNVCANVDVRQHATILPLSKEDLHAAQSIPGGLRVILAPFGLQAYLTGHVYKENDPTVQKLFSDWKKIYPISSPKNAKGNGSLHHISPHFNHLNDGQRKSSDEDYLNRVVELLVGDHRLKYPFSYVFINEADRKLRQLKSDSKCKSSSTTETLSQAYKRSEEILENCPLMMTPYYQQTPNDTYCLKSSTNQAIKFCDSLILEKVHSSSREDGSNESGHTLLNGDLLQKKACNCPKCQQANLKKQLKSSSLNGLSSSYNQFSSSSKSKDRTLEKERAKYLKNCAPFHLRSSLSLSPPDEEFTSSLLQSQAAAAAAASAAAASSPSTVNLNSSMNQSNATPIIMSYKSPVSTSTSSILNTPGIESSPLSNFNCDAVEHTSPNASKDESTSINTPINISNQLNQSPKDKTSCLTSTMSPSVNPNLFSNTTATTDANSLNGLGSKGANIAALSSAAELVKSETTTSCGTTTAAFAPTQQSTSTANTNDKPASCQSLPLKRSFLYRNVYDGDHDLRHGLLYDYSCESELDWDLPLPKNRRINDGSTTNGHLLDLNRDFADNYAFHELPPFFKSKDSFEFNGIDDHDFASKLHLDPLMEKISQNNVTVPTTMNGTLIEPSAANNNTNNNKSTKAKDTNTEVAAKAILNAKSSAFARNDDDYTGTFSDFEIFNSSGDESNENFQAPLTPKNSNGPSSTAALAESDSYTTTSNTASLSSSSSILGPAELSRMFPTPPSLEAMVASPCNTYVTADSKSDKVVESAPVELATDNKKEPNVQNSVEEEQKDCSFVYKPPVQSSFITSNKYAPLENVECKQSLPTHCYYKHNTKKQQQAMKPFGLVPPQSQSLSANLIASNKSQMMNTKGGLGGFTSSNQAMIRNVRPPSQNMPGFNNSPFMGRARPPLGMQSQMFTFPSDNFRQNSPSLNIDSSSMSPSVACSFISSPVPSFDNRKSPYSFPQSVSHNSPSNSSAFMSNSPLNNFNNSMQQKTISPMVGSGNFFNSVNSTNPNNNSHAMEGGSISATDAAVTTPHFEVNALMLNLMLSDSMFNLFRDHNFESCSICVCNMNIKGNDVGVYLPDPSPQQSSNYDYYQCTCGFSALSNRHLSQFSGLFYEDEVEITGIYYDPSERKLSDTEESNGFFDKDLKKALGEVDENVIDLLVSLSTTIFPSSSTFSKLINCDRRPPFKTFNLQENSMRLFERDLHKFVYKDFTDVIMQSLNMTRTDAAVTTSKQANMLLTSSQNLPLNASRPVLHDWSFRNSNFPVNNHEVIHMLKTLQPLMQEAVQRKGSATGSEVTYNSVKGPLTWRQFHRLAGRGTEYQCEPQPIPSLLAGYDKDCVVVSPFALKFWEKLSLEPYAVNRDIGYIALVPDNEYISSKVKLFLRELSTTYELLRFGRHFPMRKLFKDGLCVVSSSNAKKSDSVPLDDWFNNLGESNLATKIRLYAQTCCNLVPSLSVYERSLFESSPSKSFSEVPNSTSALNSSSSSSSFMNNNSSGNNSGGNNTASMNGNLSNSYMSSMFGGNVNSQQRPMNNFGHVTNSSESSTIERLLNNNSNNESDSSGGHGGSNDPSICSISAALQPYEDEDDMHKFPAIVIYIVDPFGAYGKEAAKLGCVGLLKSFAHMLKFIPENVRNNVHVQLLSIDSILCNDRDFRNISRQNQLKELAFSIYSQCKQQLIFQPNIKSLTGLGPAASFEVFLKGKDPLYNKTQLYTTPFILAPLKDKQTELGEMFGDRREKSQILFCCYCLSEDQKWLLVSCTNDKGDILQSKVINVHVPNRTRRRNAAVRRFGLDKLMSFVQTVMSESVLPWRLVIGRLGRIGHGELKDWTSLLSKKSLLKYSRQLRDLCAQCHDLSPHDQPAIYSACLISLEADTALRVFPNYYTPDERFSSSCNTCSLSTPEDASCTHILVFPTSATTQSSHANFSMMDIGANLGEEFFGNLDETDIPVEDDIDFDNFWNDPLLDDGPRRDEPAPGSPGNRQSFGASSLKNSNPLDDQDEPAQLLQQPLALAFYVSTARTGPLPRWFWANSPHLENTCPVFLKSALLIHTPFVQQNTDDLLHSNNRDCHSLDSSLTTDVLRCVLEGYNSLSWLALDPGTNDRMSCLPLHIQVLMQLYHSVQALI